MSEFNTLFYQNCFDPDPAVRQQAATRLEHDYGCEINCVHIDPSVMFAHHAKGCIIAAAKIDTGTVIYQNVTIGSNMKFNKITNQWENLGNPVIGSNVVISDGAKILGPIIIGANSVIGAGAIITKDVPANSVAYGVNRIKPKDDTYDLVFHNPMPTPDAIITACEALIAKSETAN